MCPAPPGSARFPTTQWSVITDARSENSHGALSTVCEIYWSPVYAYIRARGHSVEDSRDLTQGFFAHLLASKGLHAASPDRGRFRSFLMASIRHYLANDFDRSHALKRGAGAEISLDVTIVENRYGSLSCNRNTPERLFEQVWAHAVLERSIGRLRNEYAADGRQTRFEILRPFLVCDDPTDYEDLAAQLNVSSSGARVAVHRFRLRFGDLLRHEIAETVNDAEDVADEIRYLIGVLAVAHDS